MVSGAVTLLCGKRGGTDGRGLVTAKTGSDCKRINDATVGAASSQLDNISSLTEEQIMAQKAFLYS